MQKQDLSRRHFLVTVGASSLLAACGGGGGASATDPAVAPAAAAGMAVPLTVDLSQAGLPAGTPAYAYIIGSLYTDAALTNFVSYRLDAKGGLHQLSTADNIYPAQSFPDPHGLVSATDTATINATNYPTAWADYAIALSVTSPNYIELGQITPANMPGLGKGNNAFSMRIYISLGVPKLPFTAQAAYTAGTVTHVDPFAGPGFIQGTPGALCLYDWIECSIDSTGALNGNTTYVDQFGLPLTVNAQPGGSTQGALNQTRNQVLSAIQGFPAMYAGLVQAVTAPSAYPTIVGGSLRAISPDQLSGSTNGAGVGAGFNSYFDAQISLWQGQTITVTDISTGTYRSAPGTWTFNPVAPTVGSTISFGTITTPQIWECKGQLASGSAAQLNIGKQLLAAFNRGAMSTTLNDGSCPAASTFYPAGTPSNLWSSSFHGWSRNGLAYGFAYDDVCGANPSFTTPGAMTAMSITLGALA